MSDFGDMKPLSRRDKALLTGEKVPNKGGRLKVQTLKAQSLGNHCHSTIYTEDLLNAGPFTSVSLSQSATHLWSLPALGLFYNAQGRRCGAVFPTFD